MGGNNLSDLGIEEDPIKVKRYMADRLQRLIFNCLIVGWVIAGIAFIVGIVVTVPWGINQDNNQGNSSQSNNSVGKLQ